MAISLVQTVKTTSTSVALANTTAGNSLIIGISIFAPGGTPTASFSDGTTSSTAAIALTQFGANDWYGLYYIPNITSKTTPTLTATLTNSTAQAIVIREYSGLTTSPLDVSTGAIGNSTAAASGSTSATTQANELVIGVTGTQGIPTVTAGTGFANMTTQADGLNDTSLSLEDKTVSSTGTQASAATLGNAGVWGQGVATFKAKGILVQTVPFTVATNHATDNITLTTTTRGNSIFVAVQTGGNNTVTSVTDSGSNTYTLRKSQAIGSGLGKLYLFDALNTGATTTTLTIHWGGTAAGGVAIAREYSGGWNTFDVSAAGSSNSGAPSTSNTATTINATELVIGATGNNVGTTQTAGSGFANETDASIASTLAVSMEDLSTSATGTQHAVFGTAVSGGWDAVVATYYVSIGGATPTNLFFFT